MFNADLQVLTQPGSTGNQTYSLASNFDPKAIIVWATPQTADGSIASYRFSYGFATYRGSVVQERCVTIKGIDAAAIADCSYGLVNDAVCDLHVTTAGAATRDLEIDLVSMQGGATSQVVLNWVNLHTTASIRVFMLVLGGSDITDALVDDMASGTASTTADETVVAGFGKPELLFTLGAADLVGALGDFAVSPTISLGFAKQGEAGRMMGFAQTDGNTASIVAAQQRSDRVSGFLQNGGGSQIMLGQLDTTVANWPTDGFRMLFDANPTLNTAIGYLALRTSAQITTGANTAVIAGTPPVTQDNAAGFPPKLGFLFGWNLAASASINTTSADLGGFGVGAYDGTDDAWAGWTEDDALLTMDSNCQQVSGKVIRNYSPAAALQSEADGVFSGNNFQLSWTTVDTVAREYQWLAVGDAATAATEIPILVMAPPIPT